MSKKIKVIIKRPDEPVGHVTAISNTLQNFQRTVGGNIETICLDVDAIIICNEEGKLRNLEPNIEIDGDILVGTIIVVGIAEEDFADIPADMWERWKEFING